MIAPHLLDAALRRYGTLEAAWDAAKGDQLYGAEVRSALSRINSILVRDPVQLARYQQEADALLEAFLLSDAAAGVTPELGGDAQGAGGPERTEISDETFRVILDGLLAVPPQSLRTLARRTGHSYHHVQAIGARVRREPDHSRDLLALPKGTIPVTHRTAPFEGDWPNR